MSECENCGREDGHWIGCPARWTGDYESLPDAEEYAATQPCAFDGCSEPRKSDDKRVKYCEEHSDPKNRK